jgi:hypothetical protein
MDGRKMRGRKIGGRASTDYTDFTDFQRVHEESWKAGTDCHSKAHKPLFIIQGLTLSRPTKPTLLV